ncbi:MAG: hypothetical protein D3907_04235 [Candidatus Electrothrix sp. AUS3]|nr:hypothetical protein [Candidatus Electrothrix gigas]
MIWGYIIAQIKREKRLEDLELANFFRKEQLKRIFGANLKDEQIVPSRISLQESPTILANFEKNNADNTSTNQNNAKQKNTGK